MLPHVTMTGNCVADPELRFTPQGKAILKVRLAANNRIKRGNEWVDGDACFLDVVVWEGKAEALAEQATKGTTVMVTGRLAQRSYETSSGERRTAYEVTADEVAIVCKAGKGQARAAAQGGDPWGSWGDQSAEPPF